MTVPKIRRRSSRWRGEPSQSAAVYNKPWKRAMFLALALHVPSVHPSEEQGQSHSRNAEAVNINNYCGKSWMDAFSTCPLACPNGKDDECAELGEDYSCQSFTLCHERLKNGDVVSSYPESDSGGSDDAADTSSPTPSPTPKTSVSISFPECPPEYDSTADYSFGALVAYPVEDGDTNEVYSCQGEKCNVGPSQAENGKLTWDLVGSCVSESPADDATSAERWWLDNNGQISLCTFGDDYPEVFIVNAELREKFIFESKDECCDMYPDVCDPSAGTENGTVPTIPPALNQPSASPVFGGPGLSGAPTETPTYGTDLPTYSVSSIRGQSFLVALAAVFLAPVFL